MAELNLTRLPVGQREWATFVEALGQVDDREERYYLELKSDIDLSTSSGQAKVAKFVLGAANRMPDRASRRFAGYGLLVLGVAKDAVTGVPFFEAKDLERGVQKFVGADGPKWDFERVLVGDGRDVVIIIVDPPRDGEPPATCLRDGPENLRDGGIYIRADGETREAKGDEVRVLLARTQRVRPPVDLDVKVQGEALQPTCSQGLLDEYIEHFRKQLLDAYEAEKFASSYGGAWLTQMAKASQTFSRPEDRTFEEYKEQINNWAEQAREAWSDLLDDVVAVVWRASTISVQNLTKTFLEEVEVSVHIEGEVSAISPLRPEDVDRSLPGTPRSWGPRPNHQWHRLASRPIVSPYLGRTVGLSTAGRYGIVRFRDSGSTTLTLQLAELRPEETFESDDDEFVLLVRGSETVEQLSGSWRVTARGHNDVYEGELAVKVAQRDISDAVRTAVMPQDPEPDGD